MVFVNVKVEEKDMKKRFLTESSLLETKKSLGSNPTPRTLKQKESVKAV